MRSTKDGAGASVYDEEQLLVADTLVAAEFQVSGAFGLGTAELRLAKALIAADTLIAGWSQGRQHGAISPMTSVARKGWELFAIETILILAYIYSPRSSELGPSEFLELSLT